MLIEHELRGQDALRETSKHRLNPLYRLVSTP
jgi:hypothetical protein